MNNLAPSDGGDNEHYHPETAPRAITSPNRQAANPIFRLRRLESTIGYFQDYPSYRLNTL